MADILEALCSPWGRVLQVPNPTPCVIEKHGQERSLPPGVYHSTTKVRTFVAVPCVIKCVSGRVDKATGVYVEHGAIVEYPRFTVPMADYDGLVINF